MSSRWQAEGGDPRDYSPTRGERQNVLAYLRHYRLSFHPTCSGRDTGPLRECIDGRTGQ